MSRWTQTEFLMNRSAALFRMRREADVHRKSSLKPTLQTASDLQLTEEDIRLAKESERRGYAASDPVYRQPGFRDLRK